MIDFNKTENLLFNTDIAKEYLNTIFKFSYADMECIGDKQWFERKYGKNNKVDFVEIVNHFYDNPGFSCGLGLYFSYERYINIILDRCEDQCSLYMFKVLSSNLKGHFKNVTVCDCENKTIQLIKGGIYLIIKGNNEIVPTSFAPIILVLFDDNNKLPNFFELLLFKNVQVVSKYNLDIIKNREDKNKLPKYTINHNQMPEELLTNSMFMHLIKNKYKKDDEIYLLDLCKYLKNKNKYILNYCAVFEMLKTSLDNADSIKGCIKLLLEERCNYAAFENIQTIKGNNGVYKTCKNNIYLIEGNKNTIIINNNFVILIIVGNNNKIIIERKRNKKILVSKESRHNVIYTLREEEHL